MGATFNMIMVLEGHLGACCTLVLARALKHSQPWDEGFLVSTEVIWLN